MYLLSICSLLDTAFDLENTVIDKTKPLALKELTFEGANKKKKGKEKKRDQINT